MGLKDKHSYVGMQCCGTCKHFHLGKNMKSESTCDAKPKTDKYGCRVYVTPSKVYCAKYEQGYNGAYCKKCGTFRDSWYNYCPTCGERFDGNEDG